MSARERFSLWLRLPMYFILGCGLVFLALAGVLRLAQHSFIYHPRPYGSAYAKVLSKNGLELEYTLPFGKQTAFYIPPHNESPKRIWIAFCGNGSLALDWTGLLRDYPPNGDGFLLIDYPGYGKNAGYATISRTRATANAALHVLEERLHLTESKLPLCVLGHSLGSAAALDFAAHYRVQQIVLAAPFTSLRDEVATIVGRYLARVLAENYDNRENLRSILKENPHVRVDVFHGSDDNVIPVRMSRTLAREFPTIRYHEIPGADHVTVINNVRDQIIAVMRESAH